MPEEYPKISNNEKGYPPQLLQISQPPKVLYFRSTRRQPFDDLNKRPMVAVVGARRCTKYGILAAERIAKGLARAGVIVVSGMAIGIDSAAHKAALEAGGETIAVLGSGIDESVVYPASNRGLAREIEKHGIVMSEFSPYAKSETFFFPQRNRVISGLSLGVVVVEAKEKSGALITANFALEQNREIFAVPGGIFNETSAGTNNLIKQGAKCVSSAEEILEEFNIQTSPDEDKSRRIISAKSPAERKILNVLLDKQGEGVHIDTIIEKTKLSANDTSSLLAMMELDEAIKNLGGDYYVIK